MPKIALQDHKVDPVCMAKMACSGGDNVSQQTYLALAVFIVISTMLILELKETGYEETSLYVDPACLSDHMEDCRPSILGNAEPSASLFTIHPIKGMV